MPFGMFRSHYSPILADFGSSGVKLDKAPVDDKSGLFSSNTNNGGTANALDHTT